MNQKTKTVLYLMIMVEKSEQQLSLEGWGKESLGRGIRKLSRGYSNVLLSLI